MHTTCWTLIDQAAAGSAPERTAFAEKYYPVVIAYMRARWRSSKLIEEAEDASQEVFAECFRNDGPLGRVDRNRPSGFRPFLYGLARNVACRVEQRCGRFPNSGADVFEQIEVDETSLSAVFDRAWAVTLMKEAAKRQLQAARAKGKRAIKRVDLLQLRFRDGLPIREIAKQWQIETARLHSEYKVARKEFLRALMEVVSEHFPDSTNRVLEEKCHELLDYLR